MLAEKYTTAGIPGTLFDANTILKADVDNTPLALTIDRSRIVGRGAEGSGIDFITGLTPTQAKIILFLSTTDSVEFAKINSSVSSVEIPGLTVGDLYSGFYKIGTHNIGLSLNQVKVVDFSANETYLLNKLRLKDLDGTPVGDVILKVIDERLKVRNAADDTDVMDINTCSDVDTITHAPAVDDVLMYNGDEFVPVPEGTTFEFLMLTFTDNISDTDQLIGSGEWKAIGAITFQATYQNAPPGMTAEVAMSGSATPWGSNLTMDPVTGPELNTEKVDYPSSQGGTILFTLSQSVDGTTKTDSVIFHNTMFYGNSTLTQGNQTEASLEALAGEVGGPDESRSQTISNIPTTANYLVFAYADRLTDVAQVQRNSGWGYVTCSFNSNQTLVAPLIQSGVTNVTNSLGYSETFACVTSTLTGLANGTNDFKLLTSSTRQNYLYWGELNVDAGGHGGAVYTEANVEDNFASQPGKVASNSISSRSMTVNCAAGEYTYIAYPTWLGALTSIIINGLESIDDFWIDNTALTITNAAGFQENYRVYVSKYHSFTDPTAMTVSI